MKLFRFGIAALACVALAGLAAAAPVVDPVAALSFATEPIEFFANPVLLVIGIIVAISVALIVLALFAWFREPRSPSEDRSSLRQTRRMATSPRGSPAFALTPT